MNRSLELFEYGIYLERSDIRAHVSVVNKSVYVFPTHEGIAAIEREHPALRPAFQPGCNGKTAEGWLVRPEWIKELRCIPFHAWSGWRQFHGNLSTSQKGSLAVQCVVEMMKLGTFPFWLDAAEDERLNIQVSGTDIVVYCKKRVQVKCDYRAGHAPNGTGYVFLQKAERNPLKRR